MTRTLNSNVDVIRIPSNNIETSYRNQDCCAFVKNYTGDKGYLIKSYFNINDTDYSKEQITEYLDLLIAFGIPYKYESDNNKVTVEFSTDTLIHAQEGYVYFIFLRYLWSNLYKDLVRIAIDVTKTTKLIYFKLFRLHIMQIIIPQDILYIIEVQVVVIFTRLKNLNLILLK